MKILPKTPSAQQILAVEADVVVMWRVTSKWIRVSETKFYYISSAALQKLIG